MLRQLLAAAGMFAALIFHTQAGPFEDGLEAHKRGAFEAALRLWQPLIEEDYLKQSQAELSAARITLESAEADFAAAHAALQAARTSTEAARSNLEEARITQIAALSDFSQTNRSLASQISLRDAALSAERAAAAELEQATAKAETALAAINLTIELGEQLVSADDATAADRSLAAEMEIRARRLSTAAAAAQNAAQAAHRNASEALATSRQEVATLRLSKQRAEQARVTSLAITATAMNALEELEIIEHSAQLAVDGLSEDVAAAQIELNRAEVAVLHANRTVSEALYHVGRMYESGQGTRTDRSTALAFYSRAAAMQHASAIAKLQRLGTVLEEQPIQASARTEVGRRVALVVGNNKYGSEPPLNNPINDATALARAFRQLGFSEVFLKTDLDQVGFRRALSEFNDVAQSADWAVVYFSGHGIEIDGTNYLIPVDAKLNRASSARFEAVDLDDVVAAALPAKTLRLVIVDACRNNPFTSRMSPFGLTKSVTRGLARVTPVGGTQVAFAAAAHQVALDGDGEHSPYAEALIEQLKVPNLELGKLFRRVRASVLEKTSNLQEPVRYGELPPEDLFANLGNTTR